MSHDNVVVGILDLIAHASVVCVLGSMSLEEFIIVPADFLCCGDGERVLLLGNCCENFKLSLQEIDFLVRGRHVSLAELRLLGNHNHYNRNGKDKDISQTHLHFLGLKSKCSFK